MNKVSHAEAATKKAKVEALKKQKAKESLKLVYALTDIEDLKNEVHLSNSEVASLTKRVEISNAH